MVYGSWIGGNKGAGNKNAVLYTCCFSYDEHLIMQKWFKDKWHLDVKINNMKKYNMLRIPVEASKKFIEIVRPYIHPTMEYKVGG